MPRTLVGYFQCHKGVLNRVTEAQLFVNNTGGNIDYAEKFAKLEVKMKSKLVNIP